MSKSICLLIVTKNNESNILDTLNSVYRFVNYWIVCDMRSEDKTVELIQKFFNEKKIPGKLYVDDFVGTEYNTSIALQRANLISDYILHVFPSDILIGGIEQNIFNSEKDTYTVETLIGNKVYYRYLLLNGTKLWNFKNIFPCFYEDGVEINFSEEIIEPSILKIAATEKMIELTKFDESEKIFFEYLEIGSYSKADKLAFIIAENYYKNGLYLDALKWYRLLTKVQSTPTKYLFQANCASAKIYHSLKYSRNNIQSSLQDAISYLPEDDRLLVQLNIIH